ncbi:unnamed protein product [Absidia cylindrospora]
MDAVSMYDMKKAISKKDPAFEEDVELDKAADFMDDLITTAYDKFLSLLNLHVTDILFFFFVIGNTKQDINHSESVFVYPFLRTVAAGTNQDLCDFGPGERLTVVLTILKPICHITGICRQAIWVI